MGWQWRQLDHMQIIFPPRSRQITMPAPHDLCLQCFDSVGWAQEGHPACKKWGDGGGGHWLVRMEWRPDGWSVCLPLLIFPCTIKSRSSLLAPAHPGGPGKRAVKRFWCVVVRRCGGITTLAMLQFLCKSFCVFMITVAEVRCENADIATLES